MPRDVNGNYVLPPGNPVQADEVIESLWANSTLSDVAAELTNSLDRFGRGGMLAPFLFSDGSMSDPGLAFVNEPSTGFRRAATGDLRATVLGTDLLRVSGGKVQVWAGGAWRDVLHTLTVNTTPLVLANNVFLQSVVAAGGPYRNLIGIDNADRVSVGDLTVPNFRINAYNPPRWWDGVTAHQMAVLDFVQTWTATQIFGTAPQLQFTVPLAAQDSGGTVRPVLWTEAGQKLNFGSGPLDLSVWSKSAPVWYDQGGTAHAFAFVDRENAWTVRQVLPYQTAWSAKNASGTVRALAQFDVLGTVFGDPNSDLYLRSNQRPFWEGPIGTYRPIVTAEQINPGVAHAGGVWLQGGALTQAEGWGGISITRSGGTGSYQYAVSWTNPSGYTKNPIVILSAFNEGATPRVVANTLTLTSATVEVRTYDNSRTTASFFVTVFYYG